MSGCRSGSGRSAGTSPCRRSCCERYAHRENVQRTSYHLTLAELDRAFGPDEPFVGFYEDLFSEARIREICNLLHIDFHRPALDERQTRHRRRRCPTTSCAMVAEHYSGEVYEAVGRPVPRCRPRCALAQPRYLY